MDITSVSYLAFIMTGLLLYWHSPKYLQWVELLVYSAIFYFVNTSAIHTIIFPIISVISVYFATNYFSGNHRQIEKKIFLIFVLIVNIGMLAVLKYTNLVIETVGYFREGMFFNRVDWAAPIAISFYTLSIVSYLLDAYWGVAIVEKNPLKLFLFTSYFPLMVSGPISRNGQLHHQLFEEHRFEYDRVARGFRRIAWGIAKKLVVADRLAPIVSYMFDNSDRYTGMWVLVAGFTFVIQLYFDFSGCMDIIIGVSSCFGIELQENFEAPMFAKTVQEIWQRWHITLGAWFKNYIMYPLLKTGKMVSFAQVCKKHLGKSGRKIPTYIAMLIVWMLIGIWHGSSWKYVVGEGGWFWLVITAGQALEPLFKKIRLILHINTENFLWKLICVVRTWIIFSIGMIFFRADSLQSAWHMLCNLAVPCSFSAPLRELYVSTASAFGGSISLVSIFLLILCQFFCEICVYRKKNIQDYVTTMWGGVRWTAYFALALLILLAGDFGSSSFIYFGF